MLMPDARSIDEVLRWRAEREPDRRAYGTWAEHDVGAWLTYGEIDRRARAVAAELQRHGLEGERALVLCPPGLDYIAAFFGCLYAGVTAVPAYPPDPARLARTLPRLTAIVTDAQARVVVTTSAILAFRQPVAALSPALAAARWLATDTLEAADDWRAGARSHAQLAFLQYTSGSTGTPNGVMVSHGNLLHNCAGLHGSMFSSPDTLQVSWLPPYHDLGLIAGILLATYAGFPLVTMSPVEFLLRPRRWLEAISKTRAHISGAPNFALDLCVHKIPPEQRAGLDLRSIQFLYVAAEPVRRASLERFSAAFAGCGLDARALFPAYGLAEATLVATGGTKLGGFGSIMVDSDEARGEVISVGRCVTSGGELAIVDPDTHARVPDGRIGEIWLRGPSNALGYWNRPEATAATFGAQLAGGGGPWLRTGDLGLVRDGELYITGRLKEVIVVRGRKHFPSDIEDTIEATHHGRSYYRPGGSAAFSVVADGEERLCIAVEVERRSRARRTAVTSPTVDRRTGRDRRSRAFAYRGAREATGFEPDAVIRAIRRAVASTHGLEPWMVFLLRPGAVPKTSSGKKRRLHCRELYVAAEQHGDVLHRWRADLE